MAKIIFSRLFQKQNFSLAASQLWEVFYARQAWLSCSKLENNSSQNCNVSFVLMCSKIVVSGPPWRLHLCPLLFLNWACCLHKRHVSSAHWGRGLSVIYFCYVHIYGSVSTVNTAYCNITKMTKMRVTHEERSITKDFFNLSSQTQWCSI